MTTGTIYITAADRERLRAYLEDALIAPDTKDQAHVRQLQQEIERATIIDKPEDVPNDVITMRSRVLLHDLDTGEDLEWTLVYPTESSPENHRISVLAPLGTAMLGYRVGDTIEWTVPRGTRRLRVQQLTYQPESAGDFHL